MSETTAWVSRGWCSRDKKYHTDEDCPSYQRSDEPLEITEQEAQRRGYTLCGNCHRDWSKSNNYDPSYQDALKQAAQD